MALALLGVGCGQPKSPTPPAATTTPTASPTAPITRWSEYRSADIGIVIPYPEGWYVEENRTAKSVSLFVTAPPASSDKVADIFVQTHNATVESLLVAFGDSIIEDETVSLGGYNRRRILLRTDRYADIGAVVV